MKCYICGENDVVFGALKGTGGICKAPECATTFYTEGLIGVRRKTPPKRPSANASIDTWEDFRAAQKLFETGEEVQWLDVAYFVVNDPLFRVKFLTETAQNNPRFINVPTFTLNDDIADWNEKLAAEGIPKSRRRNKRTDVVDLVNYIAWYVERARVYLKSRDPKTAPYVIISYRERLHGSYESAVHYNGIIIDVASKVAYLFDPGVGLWGDLKLEETLRAALIEKKFVELFGAGYRMRWLVEGCHIQKPTGAAGEKISRDNYCQTWSLYVFYRFIMDGGRTEKAVAELKKMQSQWSQEEVLRFIGDDFLLGIVRVSDAYEDTLKDDTMPWASIYAVI